MLTKEGCLARRQRLWEAVSDTVEWLLIADPRHVQYLANFWVPPFSFSGGERGLLLLDRARGATLVGDNFAIRSAVNAPCVDHEVVVPWYDHQHSVINRDHALLRGLTQLAPGLKGRRGLVEAEWLPLAAQTSLLLDAESWAIRSGDAGENGSGAADLGSLIRGLRRSKHEDELDLIRQSVRAGEAGQSRLREILREGITDLEIYREVQSAAIAAAGRPAIVYGDFRAMNAAVPKIGGLPSRPPYALQAGDLFCLDYSVVLDGYRADFTNTLAVGAPSDEQQMLADLCFRGVQEGEAVLAAGVRARDVHAAVARPYRDAGYADAFTHHAGHGVGLAHPEPPILVPESDDVLVAGDVITLEPGAYVAGIGGMRFEHNYLITDGGFERLTSHVLSLT